MSELRDRLERLAARGTPRGADDVLRAAQRSGSRRGRALRRRPTTTATSRSSTSIPYVTAEPARRRGRFSTLIAATGVAALAGIGVLAVTAMFGSGGAGSPEAAVQQLADAVSHRDPLAAVDVLAPSEVRSMHDSVQHISDRAADLKIVDNASQPLAGVDLSVENLQLSSTPLADGYTKVTITGGTISAAAHRAALSQLLQQAMRSSDNPDPSGKVELARLAAESAPSDVRDDRATRRPLVREPGVHRARISAAKPTTVPPPTSARRMRPSSAPTRPTHAVQDALHALQAGDWDRLMALAPPDELPVYDYRAWIDQAAADVHPDFSIDSLTTTSDVSGDHGVVKLEASGTYPSNGNRSRWQVGGSCPSLDSYFGFSDYGSSATSPQDPGFCLAGEGAEVLPFGLLTYRPMPDSGASGPVSIEVVREDGRWYVSPVGTVLDVIDHFVQDVDERTIYPIIGLGYLLPPTGTVTINQPLPVEAVRYGQVYSFDGKAGQQVIGEAATSGSRYPYVDAQLFTADGQDLGYMGFISRAEGCCGNVLTLPKTGSYRLVLDYVPANTTLTLWDKDQAPKSLVDDKPIGVGSGSGQQCTYTGNSVSCYGTAELPLSPSKLPSQSSSGPAPTVAIATTTVP